MIWVGFWGTIPITVTDDRENFGLRFVTDSAMRRVVREYPRFEPLGGGRYRLKSLVDARP
ncbi:MAG: hypothetical protein OHK0029_20230 [Armatimonadaceae bacterium]